MVTTLQTLVIQDEKLHYIRRNIFNKKEEKPFALV